MHFLICVPDCQNYYMYLNCVFPTQGVDQDTLDMIVICLAVIQTTAKIANLNASVIENCVIIS